MNVWLVLPAKPFSQGKSRLSGVLDAQARTALNRALMIHVLKTALATRQLAGITVVSHDPEVLGIAHGHGVYGLAEKGHGLNSALTQGRNHALAHGASVLLVLPADLPLLSITDFEMLLAHNREPDSMTIAPSRDGGTNALLLNPPNAIPFQFGMNSCQKHCNAAYDACLNVHKLYTPGLQTDIDLPRDLLYLPSESFSAIQSAASPQPCR